jgi:hypothetical protein
VWRCIRRAGADRALGRGRARAPYLDLRDRAHPVGAALRAAAARQGRRSRSSPGTLIACERTRAISRSRSRRRRTRAKRTSG